MIDIRNNIVFFDGYCILCNSFIDFLFSRDKREKLFFSALQSETALNIFAQLGYSSEEVIELDSLVYVRNGQVKIRSDAVLSILSDLGGTYRVSAIFYMFPKFVRDFIYDQIASKRYKRFGKRAMCRVPNEDEKNRILE
jgi:predicted DCC family thiol-disulfide oxidoreductase YuxK|tara:strand:+ start:76 stop:492 length:417 start_codon:yes stop_codon:yes gene_type:complete